MGRVQKVGAWLVCHLKGIFLLVLLLVVLYQQYQLGKMYQCQQQTLQCLKQIQTETINAEVDVGSIRRTLDWNQQGIAPIEVSVSR